LTKYGAKGLFNTLNNAKAENNLARCDPEKEKESCSPTRWTRGAAGSRESRMRVKTHAAYVHGVVSRWGAAGTPRVVVAALCHAQ